MSDASAALILAGVDPDRIEVQSRPVLGPHLFVDCGAHVLSIVGEIDLDGMVAGRDAAPGPIVGPLPLRDDEIEIGLMSADRGGLLAEPLRHVPFARAAEICRLALAGDVDAFRPLYADERRW